MAGLGLQVAWASVGSFAVTDDIQRSLVCDVFIFLHGVGYGTGSAQVPITCRMKASCTKLEPLLMQQITHRSQYTSKQISDLSHANPNRAGFANCMRSSVASGHLCGKLLLSSVWRYPATISVPQYVQHFQVCWYMVHGRYD